MSQGCRALVRDIPMLIGDATLDEPLEEHVRGVVVPSACCHRIAPPALDLLGQLVCCLGGEPLEDAQLVLSHSTLSDELRIRRLHVIGERAIGRHDPHARHRRPIRVTHVALSHIAGSSPTLT